MYIFNIDNELKFTYKIESLENNTSEKSDIKKDKEHLELTLGKKDDNLLKRLICKLYLNFNNVFNFIINIDCYLIPFDFNFEVYDYNKKSFSNRFDFYLKDYYDFKKVNYKTVKIIK